MPFARCTGRCWLVCLIWVVTAATPARAEEPKAVDPKALKKKARQYEREGFYPLAYRAYDRLLGLKPGDRSAALSAARCAYEMRAYRSAKEHVKVVLAEGKKGTAVTLARKIDAGLERDARWKELLFDDILPRVLDLHENNLADRRKVAEVFTKDGKAQVRFRSRHLKVFRTRSTIFVFVRTDSKKEAVDVSKKCLAILDEAALKWTVDRARKAPNLYRDATFGDAVRRRDPLGTSSALVDVQWAFPAKTGPPLADLAGEICTLKYGSRAIKADDDASLRGFSGRLYSINMSFDCEALRPAGK